MKDVLRQYKNGTYKVPIDIRPHTKYLCLREDRLMLLMSFVNQYPEHFLILGDHCWFVDLLVATQYPAVSSSKPREEK